MSREAGIDSCLSLTGEWGFLGDGCRGWVQKSSFSMWWATEPLEDRWLGYWAFTQAPVQTGEWLMRETLEHYWTNQTAAGKSAEIEIRGMVPGSIQYTCLGGHIIPYVPAKRLLQSGYRLDAPQSGPVWLFLHSVYGVKSAQTKFIEPEDIHLVMFLQ